MIQAFDGQVSHWNTRLIGFACVTSVTFLHAFQLKWGLRLQNTLALIKLVIMLFVIVSGLLAFLGWIPLSEKPHNFEKLWEGTRRDPNAFVAALYNVIWYDPTKTQLICQLIRLLGLLSDIRVHIMHCLKPKILSRPSRKQHP